MQESNIKALLREAVMFLRCYADTEYADIELANQLEAAAESLGEPVAWLAQHPKYMPEPCVEIATAYYHAPDIMEREKAQGWIFTPLFSGKLTEDIKA